MSVKGRNTSGIITLLMSAGLITAPAPQKPIDWCSIIASVDVDIAAAKVRVDARFARKIEALYPTPEEIRAITPGAHP